MPPYFADLSIKLLVKAFSAKDGKGAQNIIQPSHSRLQFLTSRRKCLLSTRSEPVF